MEFIDLIKSRESVRNYDPDRKLPDAVIEKILSAGNIAPSAANLQPWKFRLVTSPEMLGNVKRCYHREWFKEAPHVLIITGSRSKAWKRSSDGYNSVETDVAIAMTHIILAAENEGLGACWIANFDNVLLREILHLTDDEIVYCITPLGYQKEGFKKGSGKVRKPLGDIVEYL
jgi:nitroreductase